MKGSKSIFILGLIIVLLVVSAFFVLPAPGERYNVSFLHKTVTMPDIGVNRYSPWRLGLDIVGGSALVYEIDLSEVKGDEIESVVGGLRDVIERRVNRFGVSEPRVIVAQKGDNYQLIVELPGIKDINEAINQIGETPLIDFREIRPLEGGEEAEFVSTSITGRHIEKARLEFHSVTREPIVTLELDGEGTNLFKELTTRIVGQPLAIFLDGEPIQIATVQEAITTGNAQISGGFELEEANLLVERLNAGALSAPIELVNQRTVNATAAADSFNKILLAGILGTLLVMLFMLIYYRGLGFYAVLALLVYVFVALAVFKILPGFTLTLAGVAGFVLSIGMAVDANILIFERTREEIKKGVTRVSAVEEGFRRAWPSIRDSNITTIISSVILYYFTSSFVRGFALTLLLGVIVSMFSAIFVTRTFLRVFIRNPKSQ